MLDRDRDVKLDVVMGKFVGETVEVRDTGGEVRWGELGIVLGTRSFAIIHVSPLGMGVRVLREEDIEDVVVEDGSLMILAKKGWWVLR